MTADILVCHMQSLGHGRPCWLALWAGFFGGSADLAPSNMTLLKAYGDLAKNQLAEKNIRFGVREHGMAAISNGIALHSSGLIPYCATFFIFTGDCRACGVGLLDCWTLYIQEGSCRKLTAVQSGGSCCVPCSQCLVLSLAASLAA